MFGNVRTRFSAKAMAFAAVMLSVFGVSLWAAPAPAFPMFAMPAPVDTTAYKDYPYIQFINKNDSIKITDEQFYDLAGKVIFPINKYYLPKKDSLVMQLENEVFPLINRDSLELAYMILRGAASPEGPIRFNKFLGEKRAETILNFIKQNIEVPADFNMEIDIEDYRTLCLMMRRMGDKDYGYVQAMCDQYLPNNVAKLKATLRAARQGTLWLRLFREYFPRLRAARVIFFFHAPNSFKKPEVIVPEVETTEAETPDVETPEVTPEVTPEPEVTPVIVNKPDQTRPTDLPKQEIAWQERVPRRELLSVKTNLLFYGVYMPSGYNRWCPIPNVALEYYPLKGHFTYGASMDFPWWQNYHKHKYFQVRNYQLEARYYLRSGSIEKNRPGLGAAFRGLYLQAYAHTVFFGICFDANRGWEGEGFGGGLGVGYVLPLSRKGHWRLEFNLQAGFIGGKYDPYQYEYIDVPGWEGYPHDDLYYYKYYGDPERFQRRQHSFSWFGPTRVGVTLAYDLLYRRIQKKRASFRPWEDITIISSDRNINE